MCHLVKRRRTICAACVSTFLRIQARSTRCTLSRRTQPVVNLSRCSRPLVNLNRCSRPVVSVAAGPLTQVSCATRNANLDRPLAMRQPALNKHSCISLRAKCFVLMSAGFSTPGTFTMVSCTHKTWVWRCLTRPTPRLWATAFDALASTHTRGFTTFAMSAAVATAPRALDALLVNTKNQLRLSLSSPHFELLPMKQ